MDDQPWVKNFSFPENTILTGGAKLKIWSKGASGATNATGNLIWTWGPGDSTWGFGNDVSNIIRNELQQDEQEQREQRVITES